MQLLVHAEYFQIDETTFIRRKTLLHFGMSSHLIGSAVLINPGSAAPIGPANMKLINAFYSKNHASEVPETRIWQRFQPDATMVQLAKVFNGWYLGKEKPLHGVIQLFNCFYLKQQDLHKALEAFQSFMQILLENRASLRINPCISVGDHQGKPMRSFDP